MGDRVGEGLGFQECFVWLKHSLCPSLALTGPKVALPPKEV